MLNPSPRTYSMKLIGVQGEKSDLLAVSSQLVDEHWVNALKELLSEFSTVHDTDGHPLTTTGIQKHCGELTSFQICLATKGDLERKEKVITMLKQVEKHAVHQILIDNQPSTDPEDCPLMLLDCALGDFITKGDEGYLVLDVTRCQSSLAVVKFSDALYKESQKET